MVGRYAERLGIAVAACLLSSMNARAGNGTHPRTPVLWDDDTPCVTMHDRSQGATLHLAYAIPFDDVEITPDEVDDSRRHQFFAFCRQHDVQSYLPTWITDADVQAAADKLLLTVDLVAPEDILEHASEWADCWHRINGDDDRRPIDRAHAEAGVDWDTSGIPAGGYILHGYTYEPVYNQWWPRVAALKLHDGDPDAAGPVAAIATGELELFRNETARIEGGVSAATGTTYDVEWAIAVAAGEEIAWTVMASELAIDGDYFAFDFTPPEPLWGKSGMIRVTFTDPSGRSYVAHHTKLVAVLPADDPGACDDGSGFIGTPCDDAGDAPVDPPLLCSVARPPSAGSTSDTSSSTTIGGAPSDATRDDGCGCDAGSDAYRSLWLLALASVVRRRGR